MAPLSPRLAPAPVRHSARLLDAALAVITVVGVVTGVLAAQNHTAWLYGVPIWSGLIPLALFLGALLFLRRRLPMTVLLLSIAAIFLYRAYGGDFEGVFPGWIWMASAAYFSAACTPRVRWVALIGVAQLAYGALDFRWVLERNTTRFFVYIVGEGLLLTILISAGLVYAAAMGWHERLRETDIRARAAEERLRVSHEVHDVVAHTLAVIGVQLNVAADALQEDDRDEAAEALRLAKDVRNRAMTDLKSLVGVLRDNPESTAPQPDLTSLGTLVADARAAGLKVILNERGDLATVPAAPAVAAYRVVQEALTNTLKHSGASKAEVTIARGPDTIAVEVKDDGRGREQIVEGHGLAGMRERVSALGGALTVTSEPAGFSVRADIPVAGSSA